MTVTEKLIADKLSKLGSTNFKESTFIRQLPNWHSRDMTDKGRDYLLRIFNRYKELIPEHAEIMEQYLNEKVG